MTIEWILLSVGLLIVGVALVRWSLPPRYRYLSSRKRRAMRLALRAFEQTPSAQANWPGCRVYYTDSEKCIVVIQRRSSVALGLPGYVAYVVRHDSDRVEELADWPPRGGLSRQALEELAAQLKNDEMLSG